MSSLLEKMKAAKAMKEALASSTSEAETELKADVEGTPAITEDLPTGPVDATNNQASPMAKIRARMAAKKAAEAEPAEAEQAGESLKAEADKIAEDYQRTGKLPTPEQEKTLLRDNASRAKQPVPVKDWNKPIVDADAKTARHVASATKGAGSLKERLAAQKAMKEPEGEHRLIPQKDGSLHVETREEEAKRKEPPKPDPVRWAGMAKIRAAREAREAKEAKDAQRVAPSKPEPEPEPEPDPEPPKGGSSLLAKMKAKQLAAKQALDHAPSTQSSAVEKSINTFGQNTLPKQPANASAGSIAKVEVEQTGIQGSPQVKEIEEQSDIAANRQEVELNEKQWATALRYVDEEQSCVMIGAAGTGKTTGVRGVLRRLLEMDKLLYTADYKVQGGSGLKDRVPKQPNVAICSFTRRAAINIRDSIISQEGLELFKWCCQTVHNLLEFAPEYYEAYDDEEGQWVNKMRFCPHRHADNKIDCDWLIIEEASMVDLTLWDKLLDALKPGTRILFLGDINQLPPVFGLPILVYAMFKLPVIELTEVYRQSVGPVLRNAHNVLKGLPVKEEQVDDQAFLCYEEYKTEKGGTSLKRHSMDKGSPIMAGETKMSSIYTAMFSKLFQAGRYDPEEDMIISPFNVGDLGTLHMNQCLAQFIGDAREAIVHEIIAGFHKHYLAVGDKVMVERQDGYITKIHHNSDYMGSLPKQSGNDLSRFGVRILGRNSEEVDLDEEGDVNFDLDAIGEKSAEELKRAASHIITVELESGEEVVLSNSGQFAPEKFTLGYCITGHKSQGSEWRNVYIIMHKKHHTLLTREWLYTTVTRARKQCTLLCKPFSLEKALASQRITGDTIDEKLAWFTSGAVDNLDEVQVTK